MQGLLIAGRASGLKPRVTSISRGSVVQDGLYDQCLAGDADFPVAEWPCSQHNYGLAFDMVADAKGCSSIGVVIPARLALLCQFLPAVCEPANPVSCQDALGLMGKQIGMQWNESDRIHFATFPSSVFSRHVRGWGFSCNTCRT